MTPRIKALALLLALGVCARMSASVVGVDLGTGAPPSTLGGYTMEAYEPGTITGEDYTAQIVNGIGSGWATWGQSYTGAVHVVLSSNPLTILLDIGTQAVYFYEEPNVFANYYMTATDSSGASVTTLINGYFGSSGVGFYVTDANEYLTSIVVTCTDSTGFAIGEFGVNTGGGLHGTVGTVPEGGATLGLLGSAMALLVGFARRLRGSIA